MDTLRADALGVYGASPVASPHVDKFALNATVYDRTMASAPWTLPSHASMFTGLLPSVHGVHTVRTTHDTVQPMPLRADVHTLAEELKAQGYQCGAIVGNAAYLDRRWKLDQGFDTWEVRKSASGREISELASDWIRGNGDQPFFLFLNYMDTHRPYAAAAKGMFGGQPDTVGPLDQLINEVMGRPEPPDPALVQQVRGLYADGVSQLDLALKDLLDGLNAMGLLDSMIVILTSDHGEYFGEHDLVEHSKDVYQEALWVPLITKAPGQREGRRVTEMRSLVDVPHLALQHIPAARESNALSRFPAVPGEHPVIAENYFTRHKDYANPVWGHRFHRVRSVVYAWPFKLILGTDGSVELYDLGADPGELRDLAAERVETTKELTSVLKQAGLPPKATQGNDPPRVEDGIYEAELEALGYR